MQVREVDPVPGYGAVAPMPHEDRSGSAAEGDEDVLTDAAEAAAAAGPKRRVKGTSRLGLLAMVLGIGACVLCGPSLLPPSVRINPADLAAAGLALAFLALLGILAGSRARSGVPLLAVLLCLTAIGTCAYQGGARDADSTRHWANGQVERYRTALGELKNRVAPANMPANPASPVAGQSSPSGQGNPGQTPTPSKPATGGGPR